MDNWVPLALLAMLVAGIFFVTKDDILSMPIHETIRANQLGL